MHRFLTRLALLLLLSAGLPAAAPAAATDVPFKSLRWKFSAQEWRRIEHLGQQSLYLKGGLAWIDDLVMTDGILEFDIALSGERTFAGAVWRMQNEENFEQFYLRPHQSGNPDANQYTPVFEGLSAWQLYHGEGYSSPVTYRFDEWMHVKVVFSGTRAQAYVDSETPVLDILELKREAVSGRIGVSVGNFAAAHFTNFSYELTEPELPPAPPPEPLPAGTVTAWQVSSALREEELVERDRLDAELKGALAWTPLPAESSGIVNLARVQGLAAGNTAFARVVLEAAVERLQRLRFGFSDRVRVYLDDRLLYAGQNDYRSRDYRYLGTIGLFDELALPLGPGRHELWFAVSESFGGWGIVARLEAADGVRVVPPDPEP